VFGRALRGDFDAVVAAYHDQGLVAVKTLDFGSSVNITAGLPVVRTSVDHGTARDIAWQGIANADGIIAAARMAIRLTGPLSGAAGDEKSSAAVATNHPASIR
jgi:4-hydroxythreonine-4-phosphate dehydrogenase